MARGQQYDELSTDPKNVRARLRRKNRKVRYTEDQMAEEAALVYKKPVTEWDMEELARGRPRNAAGDFRGGMPAWITPLVRREAERRLVDMAKAELATHVSSAIKVIYDLMTNDETDFETGRPIVSPQTKLAAAQFIIEQIMGKSKQRVDIEAGQTVTEFLAGFSGGLVKRTGEAYRPRRGQIVIDEDGVEVGN